MLVDAIIGWLVDWLGTRGLQAGKRLLLGSAEDQALRSAVVAAVGTMADQAPGGAGDILSQALLERLSSLPKPTVDGITPLRDQFAQALRAAVLPLADPSQTGLGRSFLDEIGVDSEWLLSAFPTAVIRAIEQVAASHGILAPLAARLDADAIRSDLATVRELIISPAPASVNSLPRLSSDFIDRRHELRLLRIFLSADQSGAGQPSVYVIDGMPGVGKTAFAVYAAHALAADYPEVQLFLDLHAHTVGHTPVDPVAALEAMLNVIGVPADKIPATIEARAAVWRAQIAERRVLLVLDNVTNHDQVRPLLPGTAHSLVLITSRRRLTGLEGAEPITLGTLPNEDAIQLFTQIAGSRFLEARPRVATIVGACGFLPLAIQLVAGRLRHRPDWRLFDVESRLLATHDRLSAMNAEDRNVVAAFQMSYDDLPDSLKRIFRLLGLQPGAEFSAYAVAALVDLSRDMTIQLLDDLVDQGLLTEPRPSRYRMHDLLREYALQLATEHETEADRSIAIHRLLDFYRQVILTADTILDPSTGRQVEPMPSLGTLPPMSNREQALRWLEEERPGLISMAHYILQHDLNSYSYTFAFLDLLGTYLTTLGYVSQALTLYDEALGVARRESNRKREAEALLGKAEVERVTSRHRDALDDYWQANTIFAELGIGAGQAETLHGIGMVERLTGSFQQAIEHYGDAYTGFLQVGNKDRAAHSIREIGRVEQLTGRYEDALVHHREALDISKGIGSRRGEAEAIRGIAQVQQATARYEDALSSHQNTLSIYSEIGLRMGQLDALRGIADCELALGMYEDALRHYERAFVITQEIADRGGQGYVLNGIGKVKSRTGKHREALSSLQEARAIAEECGELPAEAYCWLSIGEAERASGHVDGALMAWQRALELFEQLGMPEAQGVREALVQLRVE